MWVECETFSCIWAMEEPFVLDHPFDPSRMVMPFATFANAFGRQRSILLPERIEYDGRPLSFKNVENVIMPFGLEQSFLDGEAFPKVWIEGPDGKKPYLGPWEKFDDEAIPAFLIHNPQYADKVNLDAITGEGWAYILAEWPNLADKCDWSKLEGCEWEWILTNRPEMADKCDWSKLNGANWSFLLESQPQFADKCDWSKLDDEDWAYLLESSPEFADRRVVK
jgi:hypothetical protein